MAPEVQLILILFLGLVQLVHTKLMVLGFNFWKISFQTSVMAV